MPVFPIYIEICICDEDYDRVGVPIKFPKRDML